MFFRLARPISLRPVKATFSVILFISLSGCGGMMAAMSGIPIVNPIDAKEVAAHTTIERDVHQGITKVNGPLIFAQRNIGGNTYLVRGWNSPKVSELNDHVQIYVSAKFENWAFLSSAYSHGELLKTTVIDREVDCGRYGCTHTETVGIELPKSRLEEVSKGGFSFDVVGTGGSVNMHIPASYFGGFQQVYLRAQ